MPVTAWLTGLGGLVIAGTVLFSSKGLEHPLAPLHIALLGLEGAVLIAALYSGMPIPGALSIAVLTCLFTWLLAAKGLVADKGVLAGGVLGGGVPPALVHLFFWGGWAVLLFLCSWPVFRPRCSQGVSPDGVS